MYDRDNQMMTCLRWPIL